MLNKERESFFLRLFYCENFLNQSRLLIASGMVVWLLIGIVLIGEIWVLRDDIPTYTFFLIIGCYLGLGLAFLAGARVSYVSAEENIFDNKPTRIQSWLFYGVLQYALVVVLALLYCDNREYDYLISIFLTLISPQIAVYLSLARCLLLIIVMDLPLSYITAFDSPWALNLDLFVFHSILCGVVIIFIREQHSKQALVVANSQLREAQDKLAKSAKHSERLRIARDLHDRVGHHLTALSIQLEVANIMSDSTLKPEINKCQSLAKDLLYDVREVVTEMRHDNGTLDQRLQALVANIGLIKPDLNITLLDKASTLRMSEKAQRIIYQSVRELLTNSLKHGAPSDIIIELQIEDRNLCLTVTDNGRASKQVIHTLNDEAIEIDSLGWGNGLTGIRERLQQLRGTLSTYLVPSGFRAVIHIPYTA